jgi:hypothetical protein
MRIRKCRIQIDYRGRLVREIDGIYVGTLAKWMRRLSAGVEID